MPSEHTSDVNVVVVFLNETLLGLPPDCLRRITPRGRSQPRRETPCGFASKLRRTFERSRRPATTTTTKAMSFIWQQARAHTHTAHSYDGHHHLFHVLAWPGSNVFSRWEGTKKWTSRRSSLDALKVRRRKKVHCGVKDGQNGRILLNSERDFFIFCL